METAVAPSLQYGANPSSHSVASQHHQHHQQQHAGASSFQALYTKHKTQKRKVWQDGRLVLQSHSAALHAANTPPGGGDPALDSCALLPHEVNAIRQGTMTHLETEKFLVQVEGPWQGSSGVSLWGSNPLAPKAPPSTSMQKILQRKFRKPASKRPPPPSTQQPWQQRKRPLQPGELYRQYYGEPTHPQPPAHPHSQPPLHHTAPHGPAQHSVAPPQPPQYVRHQTPPWNHHPRATTEQTSPNFVNDQTWRGQSSTPEPPMPPNGSHGPIGWQQSAQLPTQPYRQELEPPVMIPGPQNDMPSPFSHGPPLQYQPSTDWNQDSQRALKDGARPPGVAAQDPAPRRNFAANAFDPSGFYGEDEEEEEEAPYQDDPYLQQSAPTSASEPKAQALPSPFPLDSSASRNATETNIASVVTDSRAPRTTEPQRTEESHQGGTLSTDDLLDLFGGDSTEPEHETEEEPKQTSQEGVAQTTGKENSPPVEGQDDLVLPPPSDSSDDEEDE